MLKKISLLDYQLLVFIAYIIFVSFTRSMKVSLAILIGCALFPIAKSIIFTRKNWLLLFVFAFYVLEGVLFQNPYETFVTFFGKFFQFYVVYLIVFSPNFSYDKKGNFLKSPLAYIFIVAVEVVLCSYLYIRGDLIDQDGISRLTAGAQPIGGNISVATFPLLVVLYFETRYKLCCILFSAVSIFLIVLSGTRGYMLCYFLGVFPLYYDYFLSKNGTGKKGRVLLILFLLLTVPLLLIFRRSSNDAKYLRVDQGIGSRTQENMIATEYFSNASISQKLFGVGFGCTLSEIPEYNNAAWNKLDTITDWSYNKYITGKGSPFHNFYANVLLTQGVMGFVVCFIIFFSVLFYIYKLNICNSNEKLCFILYWISFWIMNFFRWTTDCGIVEMLIFGIVLHIIHASTDVEQSNSSIAPYSHPRDNSDQRSSIIPTVSGQ